MTKGLDEIYDEQRENDTFMGFDYTNNRLNTEIEFSRYVLFKSGKTRCCQDNCNYKELKKSSPYSIYEVCFHTPVAFGIYENSKYLGYDKFHIPNCLLCKNYVDSYTATEKICRFYKYLQISRNEKFDTSRAKECRCYIFNQEEYEHMIQEGVNEPFDEI